MSGVMEARGESIATAIGQIEQAMGLIDGRTVDSDHMLHAYEALVHAHELLTQYGKSSMKPICVSCERFMRPKKNDFAFVEGKPIQNNWPPVGKGSDAFWTKYKLWFGDLWECPTCNTQVVVGVAPQPLSADWHSDFAEKVEAHKGMQLFIKDC